MSELQSSNSRKFLNRPSWVVLIVFFLTFVLRWIQLGWSHYFFPHEYLLYDSVYFDAYAREIIGVESVDALTVGASPVYVLFLSFCYWLLGPSIYKVQLVQVVLSSLSAVFIYQITRDLFSKRAGLFSGLFYAFHPLLIYLDPLLLKPALVNFFLIFALRQFQLGFESKQYWRYVFSSIFLISAALLRMHLFIFLPFFIGMLRWKCFQEKGLRAFLKLSLCVLGMLVTVFFWEKSYSMLLSQTRNAVEIEEINAPSIGVHLMVGNPAMGHGVYTPIEGMNNTPKGHLHDAINIAEKELGKELTVREVDMFWVQRAVNTSIQHWKSRPKLIWDKLFLTFNAIEVPNSQNLLYWKKNSILLKYLFIGAGWVIPLGLTGIFIYWKKNDLMLQILKGFIVLYAGAMIITFVAADYRFPIQIPLLIFSGATIDFFIISFYEKIKQSLYPLIVLVCVALFCNWPSGLEEKEKFMLRGYLVHESSRKQIEKYGVENFRERILTKIQRRKPVANR